MFPIEPPDLSHPLIRAYLNKEDWLKGRLIISPHAAFYSQDSLVSLRTKAVMTCIDYIEGRGANNQVN